MIKFLAALLLLFAALGYADSDQEQKLYENAGHIGDKVFGVKKTFTFSSMPTLAGLDSKGYILPNPIALTYYFQDGALRLVLSADAHGYFKAVGEKIDASKPYCTFYLEPKNKLSKAAEALAMAQAYRSITELEVKPASLASAPKTKGTFITAGAKYEKLTDDSGSCHPGYFTSTIKKSGDSDESAIFTSKIMTSVPPIAIDVGSDVQNYAESLGGDVSLKCSGLVGEQTLKTVFGPTLSFVNGAIVKECSSPGDETVATYSGPASESTAISVSDTDAPGVSPATAKVDVKGESASIQIDKLPADAPPPIRDTFKPKKKVAVKKGASKHLLYEASKEPPFATNREACEWLGQRVNEAMIKSRTEICAVCAKSNERDLLRDVADNGLEIGSTASESWRETWYKMLKAPSVRASLKDAPEKVYAYSYKPDALCQLMPGPVDDCIKQYRINAGASREAAAIGVSKDMMKLAAHDEAVMGWILGHELGHLITPYTDDPEGQITVDAIGIFLSSQAGLPKIDIADKSNKNVRNVLFAESNYPIIASDGTEYRIEVQFRGRSRLWYMENCYDAIANQPLFQLTAPKPKPKQQCGPKSAPENCSRDVQF